MKKITRLTIIAMVIMICLIVSDSYAANIYVDRTLSSDITNGSYSIANRNSTGSDGNAYRTIQNAVNAMSSGDDIFIRGGTYYEHDIYIPTTKSGTSSNWSSMQSYTGEWAIIDGQRACSGSIVHAVIYNGGFVHEGSQVYAKYWLFERLEITGGGLSGSSVAPAAGIWWNTGPITLRYCYLHDNIADNADENPAGFNGCSQQYVLIEYCYFKNNGSLFHEHGNSRNICMTGSTEYSSTKYDENWYVKNNIIRYNLIDANGAVGIATKASQRLTSTRTGSDFSRKNLGDKIHHNIIRNAKYGGIFYQQDYVQIYNNIITMSSSAGEEDWGIAVRRIRTDDKDTLYSMVYNNTLINTDAAAIFNGYEGQSSTPAYWWCYNNIIDSHNDDWARDDISIGTEVSSFDTSNVHIDRNYFYRCDDDNVIRIGNTHRTVSSYETAFPGKNLFQNRAYSSSNPLYLGTSGADLYKTRGSHILEGSYTILNAGIGTAHPYLDGVQIPSYVGATNPNDNAWVDTVLSLTDTTYLRTAGGSTQPSEPVDTTPPSRPSNVTTTIIQ